MAYYLDLTGASDNNYRILKPNTALNQNVTGGTINFGGALSDIQENFTGTGNFGALVESGTPLTVDPIGGSGTNTFNRLSQSDPPTFPQGQSNFSNNAITYNGNGQDLPSLHVGFESLLEIPSLAFADQSTTQRSIMRVAVDSTDRNGLPNAGNTNAVGFRIDIRYSTQGLTNVQNLFVGNYQANANTTINTRAALVEASFTIPPLDIANNLGGRRAPNIEVAITQTSGNTGGTARRNFLRIHAVELYLNTLDIDPYDYRSRTYFT